MSETASGEISIAWRGPFTDEEVNRVHADAFDHRPFTPEEGPWNRLVGTWSLGWVTARVEATGELVGFLNVPWDGQIHAWLQDVIVSTAHHRRGVGVRMVDEARDRCREAGCEWLHVDFEEQLGPFYLHACGFEPSAAGIMRL